MPSSQPVISDAHFERHTGAASSSGHITPSFGRTGGATGGRSEAKEGKGPAVKGGIMGIGGKLSVSSFQLATYFGKGIGGPVETGAVFRAAMSALC